MARRPTGVGRQGEESFPPGAGGGNALFGSATRVADAGGTGRAGGPARHHREDEAGRRRAKEEMGRQQQAAGGSDPGTTSPSGGASRPSGIGEDRDGKLWASVRDWAQRPERVVHVRPKAAAELAPAGLLPFHRSPGEQALRPHGRKASVPSYVRFPPQA